MATAPQTSTATSTTALAQSLSKLLSQISPTPIVNQPPSQPSSAAPYSMINISLLQQQQSSLPAVSAETKAQDLDSRTSQVLPILPAWVDTTYRAAGVLFYALDPSNRVHFLLGLEYRKDARGDLGKDGYFWNTFGGKREAPDNCAENTALRELHEELGGILEHSYASMPAQLSSSKAPKLWEAQGKFVLFLVRIPFDEELPRKYDARRKEFAPSHQRLVNSSDAFASCERLLWVDGKEFTKTLYLSNQIPVIDGYGVYSFLLRLLHSHTMPKVLSDLVRNPELFYGESPPQPQISATQSTPAPAATASWTSPPSSSHRAPSDHKPDQRDKDDKGKDRERERDSARGSSRSDGHHSHSSSSSSRHDHTSRSRSPARSRSPGRSTRRTRSPARERSRSPSRHGNHSHSSSSSSRHTRSPPRHRSGRTPPPPRPYDPYASGYTRADYDRWVAHCASYYAAYGARGYPAGGYAYPPAAYRRGDSRAGGYDPRAQLSSGSSREMYKRYPK